MSISEKSILESINSNAVEIPERHSLDRKGHARPPITHAIHAAIRLDRINDYEYIDPKTVSGSREDSWFLARSNDLLDMGFAKAHPVQRVRGVEIREVGG